MSYETRAQSGRAASRLLYNGDLGVPKEPNHYVFIVEMSKHLIFNGQHEDLSAHNMQFIPPTT